MPRPGRLFLPLDAGFPDDDRIVQAGERAGWLFIAMCCAAKRLGTDGVLSERQITRLLVPGWRSRLARLVETELVFDQQDGTYAIASWFRHNEPQAKIEARRAADTERKRSGRIPSGFQPDSERRAEQSREKQSSGPRRTPDDADCEHGVDRFAGCLQCRSAVTA